MKSHERTKGLLRTPRLFWEVLARGRYDYIYDRIPIGLKKMSWGKRWNLFKSGGNLIYRRPAAWSWPLHMQFELTNYCNLLCPVCPTGSKALQRPARAMDPHLFESVMAEVGPYLLTISLWAWGEPLLHPQLERFLRVARKHPVATLLSTNGQRLNHPGMTELLLREPPSHLIVALDGLTDATNSKFRVGARLEPAITAVRRMAEEKRARRLAWPVLHMRFIIMKHNQHEVAEAEAFAREHGFDVISFRTLSIIDCESPDQVHGNLLPDTQAWRGYEYEAGKRVRKKDFICQEPFWFPTLLADGTLVACEQDYNASLPMGVVAEQSSFNGVWWSAQAADVRRMIRDHPERFSFCRNCPYADRQSSDVSVEFRTLRPGGMIPEKWERRGARFTCGVGL
jgi:MoaA/NifB/PqqE/SkfB family radical SAM enzyme